MRNGVGVVCSLGVGPDRQGRRHNGDNYLLCRNGTVRWRSGDRQKVRYTEGDGLLAAVFDGLGDDDDVSSTVAARVIGKLYGPRPPRQPAQVLRTYLRKAHAQLVGKSQARGGRIGSSVSIVWLLGQELAWASVGDTRLYRLRGGRLTRFTEDQTNRALAARLAEPVPAEPNRLGQAFMLEPTEDPLRLDLGIDLGMEHFLPGDRLLLCSDGVHRWVDDDAMTEVLRHVPNPTIAAKGLADRAMARGSLDNVTAMVIDPA